MSYIVVIGSLNMDLSMEVPRMPLMGETIKGNAFKTVPGGKGANQAAAASMLGAPTAMVGRVGNDKFGEILKASLLKAGVNTAYVVEDEDGSTGVAVILVHDGDNMIIYSEGTNGRVGPQDIDRAEALIENADAIMLQLEIPIKTVEYVIKKYKGHKKIFLNPAPMSGIDDCIIDGLDFITPNETEAMQLTGIEIDSPESAFQAINLLKEKGVHYPMITMGDKGVAYFDGKKNCFMPANKVTAVDSTGAGDTFSGAFAGMYCAGKPMDYAIRFAQAAAAIAATRLGAQSSIPTKEEVLQWLGE